MLIKSLKQVTLIEAVHFLTSVGGALLIALNIKMAVLGYSLFLVSSCTGSFLLIKSDASKSLLTVAIVFGIINVLGLVRAL